MSWLKRISVSIFKPNAPVAWGRLLSCLLLFCASFLLFWLALFAAQMAEPLKPWSLLILAIAILVLGFSLFETWKWLRITSLARLLLALLIIMFVSILVWGIANFDPGGILPTAKRSVREMPAAVSQVLARGWANLTGYPGEFSRAYHLTQESSDVNSVPANEPLTVQIDPPVATETAKLEVNERTVFSSQAAQRCTLNGLSEKDVFNSEATILEGPRFSDGELWWRVGNSAGSAWCPAKVLDGD